MNFNPYQQYKQQMVQTASPEKLLLMLYDGAIKFLKQAIEAIENQDLAVAHEKILKVQDIITELMITVDTSVEVGKNLYLLYDYFLQRLIAANVKKENAYLEEVKSYLEELREVWQQAALSFQRNE